MIKQLKIVILVIPKFNLDVLIRRRLEFAENHQYLLFTFRFLLAVLSTDREEVFLF